MNLRIARLKHYFSRSERVKRRIEEINDDISRLRSELRRLRKQQLAYAVEVEKTAAVGVPTLPDN